MIPLTASILREAVIHGFDIGMATYCNYLKSHPDICVEEIEEYAASSSIKEP